VPVSASCAWRGNTVPIGSKRPAIAGSTGVRSYGSIQSILKHGLDRRSPKPAQQSELMLPDHPDIRGSRYYH
jgi:hypothetical protein